MQFAKFMAVDSRFGSLWFQWVVHAVGKRQGHAPYDTAGIVNVWVGGLCGKFGLYRGRGRGGGRGD